MIMDSTTLTSKWRTLAEQVRELGADAQALTLEKCAREMEAWWHDRQRELLTTEEAMEVSGYSRSALRDLQQHGKISSPGKKGAPLYVFGELPRKPRRLPAVEDVLEFRDPVDEIVATRKERHAS